MPTTLESANFGPLTGVKAGNLLAAEAGDIAAGILPVTADDHADACQLLALAACIPLAKLTRTLGLDMCVRSGGSVEPAAIAATEAATTDDAGVEVPIPVGVLRECRNVLAHARRVLGVYVPPETP